MPEDNTVVEDQIVETVTEPVVTPAPTGDGTSGTTETVIVQSEYTPITEAITIADMKYGGVGVDIEIPVEVANFAGEAGVDIEAVSKELYSSEDFTLKSETLEPLYEAFGKWQVDAYLEGIKAKNDALMGKYSADVELKSANEEAAWTATLEVMGGEDRWKDMSAYATANMTDAEFEEFNHIMDKGSLRMQQLMIKDLYGKFEADGAPIAPEVLDLEEGINTGAQEGGKGTALTQADLHKLILSGEYQKDTTKYDALRRAGLAKGI